MRIDAQSHVPVYLQIAAGLRNAVARGVYRPGEALPSVRALAVELGVNPNTVQRAFESLEGEGLIGARRGRGMFVRDRGPLAAKTRADAALAQSFETAIRSGFAANLSADRIRDLFESVLARLTSLGARK